MDAAATLSPSAKAALARLLTNERAGILTHRSWCHQATRETLIGRGLIRWKGVQTTCFYTDADYLCLTDEGRAVAQELAG